MTNTETHVTTTDPLEEQLNHWVCNYDVFRTLCGKVLGPDAEEELDREVDCDLCKIMEQSFPTCPLGGVCSCTDTSDMQHVDESLGFHRG